MKASDKKKWLSGKYRVPLKEQISVRSKINIDDWLFIDLTTKDVEFMLTALAKRGKP